MVGDLAACVGEVGEWLHDPTNTKTEPYCLFEIDLEEDGEEDDG